MGFGTFGQVSFRVLTVLQDKRLDEIVYDVTVEA